MLCHNMGRLTSEQKQFYKDNGYIVLKAVLPEDELNAISEEYDKLFARKNQDKMESSWVGSDADDRRSNATQTVSSTQCFVSISKHFIVDLASIDTNEILCVCMTSISI